MVNRDKVAAVAQILFPGILQLSLGIISAMSILSSVDIHTKTSGAAFAVTYIS